MASTSRADRMRYSWPPCLISVPPYLLKMTRSPTLTSSGTRLPVSFDATGADGEDFALLGLLLGGVGDDQTGRGRLLGLEALDDDPVLERLDGNRHECPFFVMAEKVCAAVLGGAVAGVVLGRAAGTHGVRVPMIQI
jgi:hypothetical protein